MTLHAWHDVPLGERIEEHFSAVIEIPKGSKMTSVSLARDLIARYPTLRPAIARALFEHYEPSREGGDGVPGLDGPERVWAHVSPVRVLVEPMSRLDTVEIAYRAAWDEEHTLGARFQSWQLVELNGSVL